jgi:hypothetical protein
MNEYLSMQELYAIGNLGYLLGELSHDLTHKLKGSYQSQPIAVYIEVLTLHKIQDGSARHPRRDYAQRPDGRESVSINPNKWKYVWVPQLSPQQSFFAERLTTKGHGRRRKPILHAHLPHDMPFYVTRVFVVF